MNGKNAVFSKKRFLLILILCLLLICEGVICLAVVEAGSYRLKYGVRYNMSPLKLQRVEITNREDLRPLYRISDTQKLYEVCFTYENIADFTSTYLRIPALEATVSEEKIYLVYPENHQEAFSALIFDQVVPVGKTGEIVCYIALEENEPLVTITENDEKLFGKGETMEIWLPDWQEEPAQWEAED